VFSVDSSVEKGDRVSTPNLPPRPTRRLSASVRATIGAVGAAALALCTLTAHVFAPRPALQIAALWLLGASLLAGWFGILTRRTPVYTRRRLVAFAALWCAGIALSVDLAILSVAADRTLLWRCAVQWLALTLSLAVGALFLRALLRVRASSLVGRLLSLVSPLVILALVLVLTLRAA